jgi:hypothetical protein
VLELHDVARRKGRMWKTKAFTKGYEVFPHRICLLFNSIRPLRRDTRFSFILFE